ncbi:MAG: hypothetical protein WCK02_15330 [Bacteroidota bacterium]
MKKLIIIFICLFIYQLTYSQEKPSINIDDRGDSCMFYFDSTTKSKIYYNTDSRPEFPGGIDSLTKFIELKIKLSGINSFPLTSATIIINTNGDIVDIKIVRGDDLNNAQVIKQIHKIIGMMPKWKPAECKGTKVPYLILIDFSEKY